ncbi:MAG: cation transporter [SAR324 cluster bacterium]|nr:cation transporter [SAR324 cluster bacterium]
MTDCCSNTACELEKLKERQYGTLKLVLLINLFMFFIELSAGILAGSTALLADSLDMLGDTIVYSFSLYVVGRTDVWKANAAILKGGIMAGFGIFVLGQAIYKIIFPSLPVFQTIGAIGFLALAANTFCLFLLWNHREEDINMRSVWLCSRNDIVANVSVLGAGFGVWLTKGQWPDILIGVAIAGLFLRTSFSVLKEAFALRSNYSPAAASSNS